jgi:HD-GYP domain-containing protein (c-di-GMP phosphodiesterase class II)
MRRLRLNLAWKTTVVFLGFGFLITWLGMSIVRMPLDLASPGMVEGRYALLGLGILCWLGLCLMLAQVFGRHIARPVAELAAWASEGGGKLPSHSLGRGDELGALARALFSLREEIESERSELADRTRALEAMNRIDRSVLDSPSRSALLGQVLDAITDYSRAEAAAIMVRDPDGGGFDLVASKGFSGLSGPSALGFLPDEDFPEALLIRYSDCYEVDLASLGPAMLEDLGLSGKTMTGLKAANLPFEVHGYYSGTVLLLRAAGGPDLARVRLLADQAGVALRDLEAREEGQRNWLAVVRSLVRAMDAKSAWTRGHSERVAALTAAMGRRLLMDKRELDLLDIASVLHDIGKIGVPEAILEKPGKLTEEEMGLVRRHAAVGAGIIEDLPAYAEVREAILHHHERWDGSGYPEGLVGEAIPLAARIIALADVHDALTDERPYRRGMAPSAARDIIQAGSGSLFDPRLVRIFMEVLAEGEASAQGALPAAAESP